MAIVIHSDKAELPRENKVNEHAKNLKFESIKELYKHMSFVAARVIMNAACNTTHGIIADTAIVYQEKESEFIGMEQYKLVAVEPSFDKKDSVDAIRIDSENYISFRYYFIAVDSNKIDKLYDLRREAVIKLFGKKIINTANKVLKAIREESVYAEQIASLVAADLQTKYTDTGMEFGSW